MRTLLALLILFSLPAYTAFAVVDPDPDGIGIYFDVGADNCQLWIGSSIPFNAFVILTIPTGEEILGYEFAYRVSVTPGMEPLIFRLGSIFPDFVPIDPTLSPDLVVEFFLGPTSGDGDTNGRLAYDTEAGPVPMHTSTGNPEFPVATVNHECVLPTTGASFGSLKALFR